VSASWATLAEGRRAAHSPAEIASALSCAGISVPIVRAVEAGLGEVVIAMRRAFPENLLGDLDHFGWAIATHASATADPIAYIRRAIDTTLGLMRLFGTATTIRFRYVHDFVYGFDWAKWVAKDPGARAEVGPFDLVFLERMVKRGHELLGLIEADDAKYPQLTDARARNPFGFSREPEDELLLHRDLAARNLLPIEAWRLETAPRWDRAFFDLRVERARALGL
jgi:hypothetical protein